MTRQYIGARYVPKFYENPDTQDASWKSGVVYEPLTMVTYNNATYTSKKEVPQTIGDPASNPSYWVATGNYNGQIAYLQQQIGNLVDLRTTETTDLVSAINSIADLFVTPESFGAVGDGVTDDTAAIQDAFDSGKNLLCTKEYYISSDITINHDATSGEERQIIIGGSFVLHDCSFIGGAQYNGGISFIHSYFTNDGYYSDPAFVIDKNLIRMTFEGCRFENINYPFVCGGSGVSDFSQELTIKDSFLFNGVIGITLNNGNYAIKIINTNIHTFNTAGIFCDSAAHLINALIDGNVLENNGTAIKLDHSIHQALITNCYFETNNIGLDISYFDTDNTGVTEGLTVSNCYFEISNDLDYILLPYHILYNQYSNENDFPVVFDRVIRFSTTPGATLYHFPSGQTPSYESLPFKILNNTIQTGLIDYLKPWELKEKTFTFTATTAYSAGSEAILSTSADLLSALNRSYIEVWVTSARTSPKPLCIRREPLDGSIRAYLPDGFPNGGTATWQVIYK